MFFRHAAYTGKESNQHIDIFCQLCYSRLSDRTGETCEASGPEGSCGSLSLFITIENLRNVLSICIYKNGEMKIIIAKPHKSYDDLLVFLQTDKNLIIEDMNSARHILTKTSYFSLISGYKDMFKNQTTGNYIDGTTFDDIYRLYRFDHELRSLFLKYMLIAERGVKSSLAYHFSATYGDLQKEYSSFSHYAVTPANKGGIQKLLNIFHYQLTHNKDHAYINHYKSKHRNVPLWIMVQALTIGQVSHMFDYLNASVPIKVCNDFHQVTRKDMHSFLSQSCVSKFDKMFFGKFELFFDKLQFNMPHTHNLPCTALPRPLSSQAASYQALRLRSYHTALEDTDG